MSQKCHMPKDLHLTPLQERRKQQHFFKMARGLVPAVPTNQYLSPVTSKRLIRPRRLGLSHPQHSWQGTMASPLVWTPRTTIQSLFSFHEQLWTGTTSKRVVINKPSVVSLRIHCQNSCAFPPVPPVLNHNFGICQRKTPQWGTAD